MTRPGSASAIDRVLDCLAAVVAQRDALKEQLANALRLVNAVPVGALLVAARKAAMP